MDEDAEESRPSGGVQRAVDEFVRDVEPPPAGVLEMEYVFEALAHPRRRYLVYSLLSSTEWTLRGLATKLVAWEQGVAEEAVSDADRDEMVVSLYHAHVPKLIAHGIVEYADREGEVIVAGESAVQVLAALEGLGASVDDAQETHAKSGYQEEVTDG
ncbi:MAG: hypothetical protein ABEJ70_04965 [Halobacteriaceae archaeon]